MISNPELNKLSFLKRKQFKPLPSRQIPGWQQLYQLKIIKFYLEKRG